MYSLSLSEHVNQCIADIGTIKNLCTSTSGEKSIKREEFLMGGLALVRVVASVAAVIFAVSAAKALFAGAIGVALWKAVLFVVAHDILVTAGNLTRIENPLSEASKITDQKDLKSTVRVGYTVAASLFTDLRNVLKGDKYAYSSLLKNTIVLAVFDKLNA